MVHAAKRGVNGAARLSAITKAVIVETRRSSAPLAFKKDVMQTNIKKCPECGSEMIDGYIGPPAWLRWWKSKKTTWTIIDACLGERLAKRTWGNVPCHRCPNCRLVMFHEV